MAALLFGLAAAGGALASVVGVAGVLGAGGRFSLPWLVPLGGLELSLDPLGGLFLALVGAAAVPASIYAIGYAGGERRGVLAYLAFVSAMSLVPLAANVMTFVIAWELMSLSSYFLVLHDRDNPESVGAAWVYAVMSQAGLACLLAGMLLLAAATGSATFADWSSAAPDLTPGARVLPLLLLGLGFASKAGVIPLHVWLPRAHPAAPSHVSALMSGVMVKLGLYGLVRASLDWLAPTPTWWGAALLLAGAVSAVVGILYAVVERDLKRLLAFSSIENVGVILIGLGAGLVFRTVGLGGLAVLAIAAALYHAVNHAAFKSLLFLGAGAVVHATGTRNMNALGGLVTRMPWTAACFVFGAAAIAALPPLNGFVSEWLIFQALLQNVRMARLELNLTFTFGLAALALTSGLTLACFVKAAGITFLAVPRSDAAARAHEAPASMRAAMVLLAVACVFLGLGPTLVLPALAGLAGPLVGAELPPIGDGLTVRISGEFAALSPVALTAVLVAALLAPLIALRLIGASRRTRWYETWACGRILQTARMEYTATAFSNPFKRVFDFFYRPEKRLDIEFHPDSRFFVERIEYANPTRPLFEEWLYQPVLAALSGVAAFARRLQSGSANAYLAYILATLLLLLVLA
jgi:hydrogenase-4 component B